MINRGIRNLHRSVGVVIALFALILSLTGVLLNHTTQFELDKRYLTWDWVLAHYGVDQVEPEACYLLDQFVISQFGDQVFLDTKPVTQVNKPLLGAIKLDDIVILAVDNGLVLLTSDGEFIEKIDSAIGVPGQIRNIGLFHGQPVIQTRTTMWRSNFLLEQWQQADLQGVSWSRPQVIPDSLAKSLSHYFHGRGIAVERVVLDIHNGHILGSMGVWLLDIVALLLAMLSLSGFWMWLRRA